MQTITLSTTNAAKLIGLIYTAIDSGSLIAADEADAQRLIDEIREQI